MVGSFLSIGKSSRVMKSRFMLSGLIERIRTLVKQQLMVKQLNLELSGAADLELFADEEQMQLVFLNLILNAIAAAPVQGKIEILAGKIRDTGEAVVSVTDNGPGIKPEHADKIFEPYFTEKPDGIGLGLAVVKRIVEEHDGYISAGNHEGGGASFDVVLPREEG
jgi:signal transduction histidine kinase